MNVQAVHTLPCWQLAWTETNLHTAVLQQSPPMQAHRHTHAQIHSLSPIVSSFHMLKKTHIHSTQPTILCHSRHAATFQSLTRSWTMTSLNWERRAHCLQGMRWLGGPSLIQKALSPMDSYKISKSNILQEETSVGWCSEGCSSVWGEWKCVW